MHRSFALFLAVALSSPFTNVGSAQAAFELSEPGASPPQAPIPAPLIVLNPPAQIKPLARHAVQSNASGFGHQVPLRFAARQIVPKGVKVSFGQDLDPETTAVDWKGGRPWPEVLRSTLRPLGMHVTFRPGAVLIERDPAS